MIAAELTKALDGHRGGAGWMARCPAHEDRKPSLSISSGKDDRALVHCHAGRGQRDVIAILRQRGLWETTRKSWGRFGRKRNDRVSDEPDADALKRSEAGHKPQDPLRAIRDKCLDCSCYQVSEVRLCEAVKCPLLPFRAGKHPGGAKAKKPAKPSRIPSGKPSSRTRGLALPNSATPIGCRHDVPVPVSRATAALAPPQRRHQHPLHQRRRRSLCCARLRSGARKRRPPVRRCARRRRDRHHVFPLRHWPLRSRGGDLTQASGRRAGRRRALPLFPARQGELKCQRTKRKSFR